MLSAGYAEAAGILSIGRREDSTTFDPIKSAQNVDNWVFSNVFDVLVRVDKTGTNWSPASPKAGPFPDDGLTYTFNDRDAKFSDGSPITAEDAASACCAYATTKAFCGRQLKIVETAEAADPKTLVVKLKTPSAPFLSSACPSERLGAFQESRRGWRGRFRRTANGILRRVHRQGVASRRPGSSSKRIRTSAGGSCETGPRRMDFVPETTRACERPGRPARHGDLRSVSRVEELKKDPNLTVHIDTSTPRRPSAINHEHGMLAKKGSAPGPGYGDRQEANRRHGQRSASARSQIPYIPKGCSITRATHTSILTIRRRPRRAGRGGGHRT